MGERRDILTDRIIDYLQTHGLAGLSLRPLAKKAGTSARLLVYHFGSREKLLETVIGEIVVRMQTSFTRTMNETKGNADALTQFWLWITDPANLGSARLLFELQILAAQNPKDYGRYVKGNSESWLALIEAALPPGPDRRGLATLAMAVLDGLLLETIASGDSRRATKALKLFQDMLKQLH